ncbi:MAG: DUF2268 domain-containing putative Zn-dependent protease [Pseudomonadota bacterium]
MGCTWNIHVADARGRLGPWRGSIEAAIARTHRRVSEIADVDCVDIVVQDSPRVIRERGHVGFSPNGWMIYLSFDPDAPAFAGHLGEPLERTLAHEINHVVRWRGPGYGTTLGDALISEGLAGVFVRDLYDSAPEPWERALDSVSALSTAVFGGWDEAYDHGEWFFGAGRYPVWAGYSLGYRIVAFHADRVSEGIVDLTQRPASHFKTSARLALQ